MNSRTLVFTGGHHTSALVVARLLRQSGWHIVWFGHRHSMWGDRSDSAEYAEVTRAGLPFYNLQAGKFYRTLNPLKLLRIPLGFIQAFFWLLQLHPTGIVSFGGYLAVPTVVSGWLLGVPSVTHEQTTTIGIANRCISPIVKKVYTAFPTPPGSYPMSKTVYIGLPLRASLLSTRPISAPYPKPTLFFFCGKQGSHIINTLVFAHLSALLANYRIIHQTGTNDLYRDFAQAATLRSQLARDLQSDYVIYDYIFETDLAAVLSRSDIVIGRSGAHTIYELGILGKRCILIPLPDSSHHEQESNAQTLVQAGNAVLLPQSELTYNRLLASLTQASQLNPHPLPFPLDSATRLAASIASDFS